MYAANGLGAVLAEMGKLDEAKEIFQEVQVRSVHRLGAWCVLYKQNSRAAVSQLCTQPTPSQPFPLQAAVAASGGFLNIPDVYVNLANVSLASEDYVTAHRLYEMAMSKLDTSKQCQVGKGKQRHSSLGDGFTEAGG